MPADRLVHADARYVLWRATGTPNCDIRQDYRAIAARDRSPLRRYLAASILGFGGPECGEEGAPAWKQAAAAAADAELRSEADLLRALAAGRPAARFAGTPITTALQAPANASFMVLGESAIEVRPGMRIGTQVDRVARDWISAQLKWEVGDSPLPRPLVPYHEGAVIAAIQEAVDAEVYPLAGALVARNGEKWFAADDTGVFRFHVLDDKLRYPTTHVSGSVGLIEDTHGLSVLVPQAVERGMQLVVGCGDSEGKVEAAFYLAGKGVHVLMPGDRYQDLLLGYAAPGVILGGAPVKKQGGSVVLGGQPVRFSLRELVVVEDTKRAFPVQYYDAPARYFRALSQHVKLKLAYVEVDAPNQLERVLERARALGSAAVAVRVTTEGEDLALREWLAASPRNRAILFHSGLYPFAQGLFRDFPQQVTFGDLRPRFG